MEHNATTPDMVEALVQIMGAWAARDGHQLRHTNGLISLNTRIQRCAAADQREKKASASLRDGLPPSVWKDIASQIAEIRPTARARLGETALRFKDFQGCQAEARAIVERAHRGAQAQEQRIEERIRQEALERERAEADARRVAEREARAEQLRARAYEKFQTDFLSADAWFQTANRGIATVTQYGNWKAHFVQEWAKRQLDEELDSDQAAAVATVSSDVHVTARAGSGKTRTLVTRALFLQQHCRTRPGEILLVAFNRKAAQEMKERLSAKLPTTVRPPHVMTFHALAYAIVRPDEDLIYDDDETDAPRQSAKVQEVIDRHLKIPGHQQRVRDAMLAYFRGEWETIERRGLLYQRDEFFEIRRGAKLETLAGNFVRSYGEKLIANTLYEYDIGYSYERNFTRSGFNYRPDFTLLKHGRPAVVIEYFGLLGNPDYDAEAARKRDFWQRQEDVAFVELTTADVAQYGPEGLAQTLIAQLAVEGVPSRRLTDDEIWDKVQRRAVDRFSKTMKTFIGRARQRDLSAQELAELIERHEALEPAESFFLDLAAELYRNYLLQHLEQGTEDFSGLVWRAAEAIKNGRTAFQRDGGMEVGDVANLLHILVDEFQDFSPMFHALTNSIRVAAKQAEFFCVGDDWQAINGFAGSELKYFTDFSDYFPGGCKREIPTNYRSPRSVVRLGNVVMEGHGIPAKPSQEDAGCARIVYSDDFQPSSHERDRFPGDVVTPSLLRIVQHELEGSEGSVAVLFRRNTIPWFVNSIRGRRGPVTVPQYAEFIREHFPEHDPERLQFTTAHKFKGREADVIVIPDATDGSYPLIHPTWPLFRVFGDDPESLYQAERRLFYVATTRAAKTLYYITRHRDVSPFVEELINASAGELADGALKPLRVSSLPLVVPFAKQKFEVRVYDGYDVRDELKRFGFQFDDQSQSWFVLRPTEGFDFEDVCMRLAFIEDRRMEASDETGTILHARGSRTRYQPKISTYPPF